MSTKISVRVVANSGKFLGDDIGGAYVTIRDTLTGVVLASGITQGDSGPKGPGGVMCVSQPRGKPIPYNSTTSAFNCKLALAAATKVEISAYGPLAAQGSANTVSTTTWLAPWHNLTGDNAVVLELRGLICQVVAPPTHTTSFSEPATVSVAANVAMMCGCPITMAPSDPDCKENPAPWNPADFDVEAVIESVGLQEPVVVKLVWDDVDKVAGKFQGSKGGFVAGIYKMTVVAYQVTTGNTGVDVSTFVVQPAK